MTSDRENLYFNSESKYILNKSIKKYPFRIYVLLVTFLFSFIVIGAQMIITATHQTVSSNRTNVIMKENPKRKDILDRNGVLLATNVKVDSLYAHPSEIINKEKVVNSLGIIFPQIISSICKT